MEVIVYPIEQWFCYYVIDELLKEGYEVYAYREIEAKDASEQINNQIEQLQLSFGRNAGFHLEEGEVKTTSPSSYGIFIEKMPESDLTQGILLSNRVDQVAGDQVTIISIEEVQISDDECFLPMDQTILRPEDPKKERDPNEGEGKKKNTETKMNIPARKLARWMIMHGMNDLLPQKAYLHGKDQLKSIYSLS